MNLLYDIASKIKRTISSGNRLQGKGEGFFLRVAISSGGMALSVFIEEKIDGVFIHEI
jgi:hypothetical protein